MVSRRTNKARGSNAERELVRAFWENGWAAMRAAGSGSSQYPCPDLLVSNNVRRVALEVKLTIEERKYFTKQEILELKYFSEKFGAEAWVAVKFPRMEWKILSLEDLDERGSSWVTTVALAELRGLSVLEFIRS